ncbi:MAG: hypothetical protein ACKOW3_10180 [Hyphomicrobium sp.]
MRKLLLLSGLILFSFGQAYTANASFCKGSPFARSGNSYDRFAYRYRQPCYYPYYNSGYWKPTSYLRKRPRFHYDIPPYYPAWGYPSPSALSRRWGGQ